MPSRKTYVLLLFGFFFYSSTCAANFDVKGLLIESVAQIKDDEEAPFNLRASNKRHKCGGKPSNLFRVYSEHAVTGERMFSLSMSALIHGFTLSVSTNGCDGNALIINQIRIQK